MTSVRDGQGWATVLRRGLLAALLVLGTANAGAQTGPSACEAAQYTGLHAAASNGDVAQIEKLLAARADPDHRDGHGRTPLHVATPLALARSRGYDAMVQILLKAGAR